MASKLVGVPSGVGSVFGAFIHSNEWDVLRDLLEDAAPAPITESVELFAKEFEATSDQNISRSKLLGLNPASEQSTTQFELNYTTIDLRYVGKVG